MRLTRLDDYQSWALHVGAATVLVDPWLGDHVTLSGGPWLFRRAREVTATRCLPVTRLPAPTHLLLTAPFADHCDPPTLRALRAHFGAIPAWSNGAGAKRLRALGWEDVEVVRSGDVLPLPGDAELRVEAPGFPYAHNSLGAVAVEHATDARPRAAAYLETHTVPMGRLAELAERHGPVDAVISTCESVRLFGVTLAMAAPRAVEVARALSPGRWIPTGVRPGEATGLLATLLRVRGDVKGFEDALSAARASGSLPTTLLELAVGETVDLAPGR